jgi:hypothetical protein
MLTYYGQCSKKSPLLEGLKPGELVAGGWRRSRIHLRHRKRTQKLRLGPSKFSRICQTMGQGSSAEQSDDIEKIVTEEELDVKPVSAVSSAGSSVVVNGGGRRRPIRAKTLKQSASIRRNKTRRSK